MNRQKYTLSAALALLTFCCWVVNASAADGPPKRESFEFKNKAGVMDEWHGIYLEGRHVGWRHVVVSKVKHGNKRVFLREETEHLEFDRRERNVEIKALYTFQYQPIAMLVTEQAGKSENKIYVSAVYTERGDTERHLDSLFVQRKNFAGNIHVGNMVMFECAAEQYFRYKRRANPEEEEERWAFDVTTASLKPVMLMTGKLEKRKINGVEVEVREMKDGGTTRYFNRAFEPLLIEDMHRGLRFIRCDGTTAKSKGSKDGDYVPDSNLSGNTYDDRKAGFAIRRPSADWSVHTEREGPLTVFGLTGLMTGGKAFGIVCTGIPADADMKAVSKRLKELAWLRILSNPGWRVKFGKDGEAEHEQDGHERVDCNATGTIGIVALKGKCSVITNGNVAMLLLCLCLAEKRDENEKAFDEILESIRLTPVKTGKPPTHTDAKLGFELTPPDTLWRIEENEGGIILFNPWLNARAAVGVMTPVPNSELADVAAQYLEYLNKDWALRQSKGAVQTELDGETAKRYKLKGPLPFSGGGVGCRAAFYVVLREGLGYGIMVALPADLYKKDKSAIDGIIKGFKFIKIKTVK